MRKGSHGDTALDGLNVMAVGRFEGNIWAGAKQVMGIFIDQRANDGQRQALQAIFGGRVGGWPGQFAQNIAEVRGIDFAPIEFEVAGDLATWRASVPGMLEARAEALTGPTAVPGQRVQGMWVTMMAAMMLPTVAPMVLAHLAGPSWRCSWSSR